LSLGLVLFSTILSPITTPAALHAVGWMASGEYRAALFGLASYRTDLFLVVCVAFPSVAGILVRTALSDETARRLRPKLKLLNSIDLLLLCYSNAAVSLPQAVAKPDLDFLVIIFAIVATLCALAFTMGALLARLFRLGREAQVALMFGLGMNNNGTGLVLASMSLATLPQVMLPIIFYNLVQHLVAGVVAFLLFRPRDRG
jgi:BASS family bile acid:Na+ symporter